MRCTLLPGHPYPLGATVSSKGTNFSIFSEGATRVELCLFDADGKQTDCIPLHVRTAFVWHGIVREIKHGQLYGYRVHRPWEPERGHRLNPNKLLVDPYAKSLSGEVDRKKPIFAYDMASGDDLKMDTQDSADGVPKSVVVKSDFDWGDDCRPDTPLADSVIYELNVRGFSIRHPNVAEKLRGTLAGLGCTSSIDYLKKLGVTAVELLPIHHFIDEGHLLDRGLPDYWGYNTLNFFSPMSRYSSAGDTGGQVDEFKQMVKALHAAGIEVIRDVVYNHTCEGNQLGPTLSWKGVCNTNYYRLVDNNPRYYMDYTGTGNTLNVRNPQGLKMLMDSLRYTDHNDSWNMGAEGPTDDPQMNLLRARQIQNFLATLMLSQGVPMLSGGDEFARSQHGNNNCYCQDNELTWHDWNLDEPRKKLLEFTSQLIHFRLSHPNLHRRKFFQDRQIRVKGENTVVQDVAWFNPDGNQLTDEVWSAGWSRSIAMLLNGQTLQVTDENGKDVIDDSLFLIINAAAEGVEFKLPVSPSGQPWCIVLDTEDVDRPFAKAKAGDKVIVGGRSLKLLSDHSLN